MQRISLGLKELETRIDLILTSPYLRATQTAGILARTLGLQNELVLVDEQLAPPGYLDRMVQALVEKSEGVQALAIVGHEPLLSNLVGLLVSGDPSLCVNLKKGGVCKLSLDRVHYGRCATLEWLLSPAQLAEIGA